MWSGNVPLHEWKETFEFNYSTGLYDLGTEHSPTTCPFKYQGQYYDSEVELCYNRFRYYHPETGRYISQDPIGFLSGEPNFFAYVGDTNAWVDLLGLQSLYRGGRNGKVSFKAREKDYETKVVDGKEVVQPTRGVSLSDKKENLEKMRMEAYEVDQIPETLQIVKTGRSHYEITPKKPMTVDEYQAELAKVTVKE